MYGIKTQWQASVVVWKKWMLVDVQEFDSSKPWFFKQIIDKKINQSFHMNKKSHNLLDHMPHVGLLLIE